MGGATLSWFAHAFGQTYELPVPLWLFLFGSGVAVAVSFVVIGLLAEGESSKTDSAGPKKGLGAVVDTSRFLGIFFLAVTVITGLVGAQTSMTNFSITFFWIIFLLGFTYLVAVFGNLWTFVNPFDTLLDGINGLIGKSPKPRAKYPAWLGYWPALLGYFGLIWIELVDGGLGTTPRELAFLIIGYTGVTLAAAYWFGRDAWFTYGELFSVFFRLASKVSPIRIEGREYSLRRPFDGLVGAGGATVSLLVFILFMLASTGFDGLKETVVFGNLVRLLPESIETNFYAVGTISLIAAPLLLLAVYLPFVALTKRIVATKLSVWELAYRFAFSLVPIAVAYHAAHYFTLLLITGQAIIPQLSDPFGSGLDLFGTAGYTQSIGFLTASIVWYSQVALIVIGHIGAVYVAHMESLKIYDDRRQALLSQIPMVVLMVLYTAGSLWIIAQPIAV